MTTARTRWTLFAALAVFVAADHAAAQTSVGSALTYQGQLSDAGGPLDGTADLIFTLHSSAGGMGDLVAGPVTISDVAVSGGVFTAPVDFGVLVFNGDARWLEIQVRSPHDPSDALPFTTLAPRQPITPSPMALALPGIRTPEAIGIEGRTWNVIGGYQTNAVTSGATAATIAGGGTVTSPNTVADDYGAIGGSIDNTVTGGGSTIAGGRGNVAAGGFSIAGGGQFNTATGDSSVVSGGLGNTAGATFATVGGGLNNNASMFNATIGGGDSNAASGLSATVSGGAQNTAGATNTTVGGGSGNQASAEDATVSGGDSNAASGLSATVSGGSQNTAGALNSAVGGGINNRSSAESATVGGGDQNEAEGRWSTVAGGYSNSASASDTTVGGGASNAATQIYATVAGGGFNIATGRDSTVAGGELGWAQGNFSTVGGGQFNIASGFGAVVPGGYSNEAGGNYSFAAGRNAHVRTPSESGDSDGDEGTFVWADNSSNDPFTSTGPNQFRIRAHGGMYIDNGNNPGGGAGLQIDSADDTQGGLALYIKQRRTFTSTDFPGILLTNANIPSIRTKMRVSDDGFFDVRVDTGSVGGPYARLDSTGVWTAVSDRRHKADIEPLSGLLGKALSLEPVGYRYAAHASGDRHIGFIAQDVRELFPSLVTEGETLTLNYSGLSVVAIAALQELKKETDAEIAAQRTEIESLRAEQAELESRLARLEALLNAGATAARWYQDLGRGRRSQVGS